MANSWTDLQKKTKCFEMVLDQVMNKSVTKHSKQSTLGWNYYVMMAKHCKAIAEML